MYNNIGNRQEKLYPAQHPCSLTWSQNWQHHCYYWSSQPMNTCSETVQGTGYIHDYGGKPLVLNIDTATKQNNNYRTALWTGEHLQVTLMSIPVGGDIGLEVHPVTDQFLRIEEGQGFVQMGHCKDNLDFQAMAYDGYAIMVPAGTWHNVTNTGNRPLKMYSIYAPPKHPSGIIEATKPMNHGVE